MLDVILLKRHFAPILSDKRNWYLLHINAKRFTFLIIAGALDPEYKEWPYRNMLSWMHSLLWPYK